MIRRAAANREAQSGSVVIAALMVLAALTGGCGLIGKPGSARLGFAASITVTSPVVGPDATLPKTYTCHGEGTSPPLYWSGAPQPQTKSLVVVVDDSQAPISPYIYWIVYDISPGTTSIPQGGLPAGAREGPNSTGRTAYDPPCPQDSHNMYRFTVYALNAGLNLAGSGLREAWSTIAQHVIASGRLTVRASR